jgi:type IV secretory pathway VirB2 component (pilin)
LQTFFANTSERSNAVGLADCVRLVLRERQPHEAAAEVEMSRLVRFRFGHPIKPLRRSKSAPIAAALLTLLFFMPMRVLAQSSPFDTGFNAIQSLFTGTIAKVASLVAIVIGGYGFAHGEPGAKKALAGVAAGTGIAVLAVNVLSWLWGV